MTCCDRSGPGRAAAALGAVNSGCAGIVGAPAVLALLTVLPAWDALSPGVVVDTIYCATPLGQRLCWLGGWHALSPGFKCTSARNL